jgi:segregation and condensation protein B
MSANAEEVTVAETDSAHEASMNDTDLKHTIEATLLAAGRPVTAQQLLDLFDERERPTPEQLQAALDLLAADYENRGIELLQVASGWRIQVRSRCVDVVSRLWQERPSRYSRALLETLALVAYRQPITRSEIEEIRGVAISSTIMRTLQERNWIRVVGHREVPGRPELLGTTREFLDYFGLKSLDQLPTLADLRDVENIGVQLELPAGDVPQAETVEGEGGGETVAEAEAQSETDATAEAEGELSADGDEGEEITDEDESDDADDSTLVASSESDPDDSGHAVREPPSE